MTNTPFFIRILSAVLLGLLSVPFFNDFASSFIFFAGAFGYHIIDYMIWQVRVFKRDEKANLHI